MFALRILCFLPLAILLVGCADTTPKLTLYPTHGKVMHNGKGVKGGGMILIPMEPQKVVFSINCSVNDDGTFLAETIRTGRDGRSNAEPGVPVGKYKAIYHPPSNGSKLGLDTELPEPIVIEAKENELKINLPEKLPEGKGEQRDDDLPVEPKKDKK